MTFLTAVIILLSLVVGIIILGAVCLVGCHVLRWAIERLCK
jgi:hypothetical protein